MNNGIKEIEELNHPDRLASVKLVIIGSKKYVLKSDTVREIAAQVFFNEQLERNGLPSLITHKHTGLRSDQILFEYVENSLTLGDALSEERCRLWGELVARMHSITTTQFTILDPNGNVVSTAWQSYLKQYIQTAFKRHKHLSYPLDAQLLKEIGFILSRLLHEYKPSVFSLTHGDLHVHNVLIKKDELILFDKFADFLVAPSGFDLGVLYGEAFAGAAYPALGFSTSMQQKLFTAFMRGYGSLPCEQQEWIEYFTLLRAFYRWPNRFAPHSGETIRFLVQKLK